MICFYRNEVIFNGKKCIVINVRDLTEQDGLFSAKEEIKNLHQTVDRLSAELIDPIQTINEETQKLLEKTKTTSESNNRLIRSFNKIKSKAKYTQLKL